MGWGEIARAREDTFSMAAEIITPEQTDAPSECMTVTMRQPAVRTRGLTASQKDQTTKLLQTLHAPLCSLSRGQSNNFSHVSGRTTYVLYIYPKN